ncbi:hypothetical protein BCR37DRAFT_376251, partial [Protomyces lactucae-debilis]
MDAAAQGLTDRLWPSKPKRKGRERVGAASWVLRVSKGKTLSTKGGKPRVLVSQRSLGLVATCDA